MIRVGVITLPLRGTAGVLLLLPRGTGSAPRVALTCVSTASPSPSTFGSTVDPVSSVVVMSGPPSRLPSREAAYGCAPRRGRTRPDPGRGAGADGSGRSRGAGPRQGPPGANGRAPCRD